MSNNLDSFARAFLKVQACSSNRLKMPHHVWSQQMLWHVAWHRAACEAAQDYRDGKRSTELALWSKFYPLSTQMEVIEMARRNRNMGGQELRQSIGDSYVSEGCGKLTMMCTKAANLMYSYGKSREETLPMLFSPETLRIAREAKNVVPVYTHSGEYEIEPYVELVIDFEKSALAAILPTMMQINHSAASPLLHYVAEIKALYFQYEEVKAVLRWLNRNATPGAIRYLFPSALTLCPNSPQLRGMDHLPTRFTNPANIGPWLPRIKNATNTMAQTLLLPNEATAAPRSAMRLAFSGTTVGGGSPLEPGAEYETDRLQFFVA